MSANTRRQFLANACAMIGLGAGAGFANDLLRLNALAADTEGYRALVCVFLFGGMDNHDTVIPFDTASFNAYADIRQSMLSQYATARNATNLLELTGADLGGRTFAFPPEMQPLHQVWQQGKLAVVGNVGPLVEPTTKATFDSGSAARPPRLFSHNDQQSVWMASEPEGAAFGWGGRLADAMLDAGANTDNTFTAVSAAGSSVFLTGQQARAFQVSSNGAININASNRNFFLGSNTLPSILDDHFRDLGAASNSLFQQDVVDVTRYSLDSNAALTSGLASAMPTMTQFPAGGLAGQLSIVAQMIQQRASLGAKRQIFFVSTGGYDTHSAQAAALPGLQAGISAAMRAFHDTMEELGVGPDVTLFTASDFGRTLRVNGDGTDHGWGAHHVVMGGGVNGGRIFGDIPPSVFDHDQDAGRGRLIPSLSVDQYAAGLGGWFGVSPSELSAALPNLGNFDADALSGLFAPRTT